MAIDLEHLNSRELSSLISAAELRLRIVRERRPISVVRRELAAIASSFGYTVADLFGARQLPDQAPPRARRQKLGKVAAKYRNPENHRETWTGRGRMPRWLDAKVRRGMSATDFLIPGIAMPTTKKSSLVGRRTVFKQAR